MGSLLNRASRQDDISERKLDKRKRRHQQLDQSYEHEAFLNHDENEHKDPNAEFFTSFEQWHKEFTQQNMMNTNDPPGAPRTYTSHYSAPQNDILAQSWSNSHNTKNSFYPLDSLQMTTSYNIPYIPDQYNHTPIPSILSDQSRTVVAEERPSNKIQSTSFQQRQSPHQTTTKKPLVNTRSWHESNNMTTPTTATKPERLSNRSSVARLTSAPSKTTSVEKPIYVGIDHKATLAERGQTIAHKRRRKSREKNHSDGVNSPVNNHRTRSVTSHRTPTDSPNSNIHKTSTKPFDSLQPKSSNSQRILIKSESTNKLIPFISSNNNELKPRNNHRQPLLINNDINWSKNRENQLQNRQHHTKELSLNPQTSARRIENQSSNKPVMRIPLSQFNHKQPIIISTTTRITRTRV